MISTEVAVTLLSELVSVEVQATKEVNTKRGLTKKTVKREREAVLALFRVLTGCVPNAAELEAITGETQA